MSQLAVAGPIDPLTTCIEDYLARVVTQIEAALAHSAAVRQRLVAGLPASPLDSGSRLEAMVLDLVRAGGKMIRPRLLLLGHLAVSDESVAETVRRPDVARLGAALELVHVFGLLQDDVMDESATRRGAPTAHERLAAAHRRHTGGEGAQRFGESGAVLAGDLAFALAQRQLRGLPDSVIDAWDETVLELVQGQRLDLAYAAEGRVDAASTQRVAAAKSGAYTVVRPLQLGALLARPDTAPPGWLLTYGEHVGQAFAFADDLLGVWGDPAVTGKPAGDDLVQRKPTTVLGLADELVGGRVTELLHPRGPAPTRAQVAELVAVMEAAGVREAAEARVDAHVGAALAALAPLRDGHVRTALVETAHRLAHRPH